MRSLFLTALLFAVAGCSAESSRIDSENLLGQTEAKVVSDLGPPDTVDEFSPFDGVREFRIEILNFYPAFEPASKEVTIRESIWNLPDGHRAVWFHRLEGEWIVLHTYDWSGDQQF